MNKKIFGFDCLGCGMQRSVALILKGEFIAAFKMYPAIYPLLIFISLIIVSFFTKSNPIEKLKYSFGIITIATILVSFIIKIIY